MSNFNGSEFFKASGNNSDLARSMFFAAFGLPSFNHVDGQSLEIAISEFEEMQSFEAGHAVTIYDNCVNRFDHSVDETLTIDKDGMMRYVRASGCGNCNKRFHWSDKEGVSMVRDLIKGNERFTKFMLLTV